MAMASSLPPGFEGAVLGSLPADHIPQKDVPQQGRESKKVSWASEDILCQVNPPPPSNIPSFYDLLLTVSFCVIRLGSLFRGSLLRMLRCKENEGLKPYPTAPWSMLTSEG